MSLGKIMGDSMRSQEDIGKQLYTTGSTTTYFFPSFHSFKVTNPYRLVIQRDIGSSFVLNHPTLGLLGSGTPHIPAGSQQPFLGDSRGVETNVAANSPGNIYTELFEGSRFRDEAETTADWNTGSRQVWFTSGDRLQFDPFFIGPASVTSIKMNALGSNLGQLDWEAASDDSTFETIGLGSPHTFSSVGSTLSVRATEDGTGSAVVDKTVIGYTTSGDALGFFEFRSV